MILNKKSFKENPLQSQLLFVSLYSRFERDTCCGKRHPYRRVDSDLLIFFLYKGLFRIMFCEMSLLQNDFKNYTIGGQKNILYRIGLPSDFEHTVKSLLFTVCGRKIDDVYYFNFI